MNKKISIKHLIFSFFLLAALSACGSPSSDTSAGNPETGSPVILSLHMQSESRSNLKTLNAASVPITSIKVEVTGDNKVLASETEPVLSGEVLIKMKLNILPGGNRTFFVAASNAAGVVLEGSTTVDIKASGGNAPQVVTIALKAVQGPTITPPSPTTFLAGDGSGLPATNPEIQVFLSRATAFDASGNAITEITNDAPAIFPIGVTTVTFSAADSRGNTITATSTVTVSDEGLPVITLLGAVSLNVAVGAVYVDTGAAAFDGVDGDLTGSIVTVNPVNTNITGIYLVTYNVSDAAGNAALQVSRSVTVAVLPVTFGTSTDFSVEPRPFSVAMGDLNGDGKLDIATANIDSDNVSILLGDGTGSFGIATNFPVGVSLAPVEVVIGDFNGDGKPDLATANNTRNNINNSVSILLGDGTGAFGIPTTFPVGESPNHIAIGDFNGDGKLDIATSNFLSNNASILLGDGVGAFSIATNFFMGTSFFSLEIADLNEDGKLDLLGVNFAENNVSVRLGNGDGSFGIISNFPAETGPTSLVVRDFNGDGQLDVATANFLTNDVSIRLGDGTGSFGPPSHLVVGTGPVFIAAEDLDGDGNLDLATANRDGNNVSVLLGDGAGSFGPPANFAVGVVPISLAIGDINGDGRPDLATSNETSNDVSILLNTTSFASSGSFGPATHIAAGMELSSIATADFNGDGKPDLAVANIQNNSVGIRLGDGAGSFGPVTNFPVGARPVSLAIGDFNQDGKPDLAAANSKSDTISILLGNGLGSFTTAKSFAVSLEPVFVATEDFNGDGKLDLVTANFDDISILLGDGAGSFSPATNFANGAGEPLSVAIGDLNGDGKLDLATANLDDGDISILLGDGAGSFGIATNIPLGDGTPISIAIEDLNGDGNLDLATANLSSFNNDISILLGNGMSSFGIPTNFSLGLFRVRPEMVLISDFNRDGKLDLATANLGSNSVSVLFGNGAGSFGPATHFGVGLDPISIVMKDFNGDGRIDLATANRFGRNISILLNQGEGGF